MKAFLDTYLGKFISRKLTCLLLGVGLETVGHLSQNMMILMATYIGVQGANDIWKMIKS